MVLLIVVAVFLDVSFDVVISVVSSPRFDFWVEFIILFSFVVAIAK